MRTFVAVLLRILLFLSAFVVLVGAGSSLGWVAGSRELPSLFALGGWDSIGILARLQLVVTVVTATAYVAVALPSPLPERRVAWGNLGYILSIVGVLAVLLIDAGVAEQVRAEYADGASVDRGAGFAASVVGRLFGGAVCWIAAREG